MHSSDSFFDGQRPETFGSFVVRADMGLGRFGPVYRAHDPSTDQDVVVRAFTVPMSAAERRRLVKALAELCDAPLDHGSIARPLAAGVEGGHPFLVHTLLPGIPLQAFLTEHGPQGLPDVVRRITLLAAAVDVAAAAGVHHGTLGAGDVILSPDGAGISGFGLVQALKAAGIVVDGESPTWSGDVAALARIAFELLCGHPPEEGKALLPSMAQGAAPLDLQRAFDAALSAHPEARPQTALAFAAALQHAIVDADVAAVPDEALDLFLREDGADGNGSDAPRLHFGSLPEEADAPTVVADSLEGYRETGGTLHSHRMELATSTTADEVIRDRAELAPHPPATPAMFAGSAAPDSSRSGWLIVAAALAMGLLGGFASGYVAGQRGESLPLPPFAEDVTVPPHPAATRSTEPTGQVLDTPINPPLESDTRRPAVTRDSGFGSRDSEAGRRNSTASSRQPDAPASGSRPAVSEPNLAPSAPASDSRAANAEAGGAGSRTPPAGSRMPGSESHVANPSSGVPNPGSRIPTPESRLSSPDSRAPNPGSASPPAEADGAMHVLSRPEGAQVFVDGKLVGLTPLVVPGLRSGMYDVRIELAGHQRWATTVRVEPGGSARVAASLER